MLHVHSDFFLLSLSVCLYTSIKSIIKENVMTQELKKILIPETKATVIKLCREYNDCFSAFLDKMEKDDDEKVFSELVDTIHQEAQEKAATPFQKFIVSYVILKKNAMGICKSFFELHDEVEKKEMQKEEYIKKLEEFFVKKSQQLLDKMGHG